MTRVEIVIWLSALVISSPICWWLQNEIGLASCFWAFGLNLFISWYIAQRLVAKEKSVPKMSTAWPGYIIATTLLRMLLVMVLGGVLFALKREQLGICYWICVLFFYLVGLVLQTRHMWSLIAKPRANSV